jgi:hypothetical protein
MDEENHQSKPNSGKDKATKTKNDRSLAALGSFRNWGSSSTSGCN